VQACGSRGTVVTAVTGIVVFTSATGGEVCVVQPARKTAAMQRRRRNNVFLSILKIGCNYNKPYGDCGKGHRYYRIEKRDGTNLSAACS
jgi:hypothetical protein